MSITNLSELKPIKQIYPSLLLWILFVGISGFVIAFVQSPANWIVVGLLTIVPTALTSPLSALILVLIFSPMHALIETEIPGHLPMDVSLISLILAAIAWLMDKVSASRKILHLSYTPLYLPLVSFLITAILTVFSAASITAWASESLKWIIIFLLIIYVLDMRSAWEWLLLGLVLAGVANAVVGLYVFFGGSGAPHLLVAGKYFRAIGTFGQPNPFGGFMGLIAPLAIMATYSFGRRIIHSWQFQRRVVLRLWVGFCFYLFSSLLVSCGVFISWSRGAWLGFVGSIVIILVAIPRKLREIALSLMLIVMVLVSVWQGGYLPDSITQRVESAAQELFTLNDVRAVDITQENYAIVERLAHWQAAINIVQNYPWAGVGFGNYEIVYERYRLLNWIEPLGHAHNFYLNVFAETGIIGLISYCLVIFTLISMTWYTRKHPDLHTRSVAIGLLGSWSYLLIHSFTDNLFVNNMFIHIGVMFGISAALHYSLQRQIRVL